MKSINTYKTEQSNICERGKSPSTMATNKQGYEKCTQQNWVVILRRKVMIASIKSAIAKDELFRGPSSIECCPLMRGHENKSS